MTDKPSTDDLHKQLKAYEGQNEILTELMKCVNKRSFKGLKTDVLAQCLGLLLSVHKHSLDAMEAAKTALKVRA